MQHAREPLRGSDIVRIIVQKFGGTSMATSISRQHVIKHICSALEEQAKLVVVVSAMGRKEDPYATDTFLHWIEQNGGALPPRETDLLLSCGEIISAATLCSLLHTEGIPSTILTGAQAGIITNANHGDARILSINPAEVLDRLKHEPVVIVTGFQGKTQTGEVTTLGRGGDRKSVV